MVAPADEKPKKEEEYILSVKEEKVDLRKKETPLVDIKITNPVTYLKRWWKGVMASEGIDIRFKIKPITAFLITVILAIFFFETADVYRNIPPSVVPTVSPGEGESLPKEIRLNLVGKVYKSPGNDYLLLTDGSKAVELTDVSEFNMEGFIGQTVVVISFFRSELNQARVLDIWAIELNKSITPTTTGNQFSQEATGEGEIKQLE